MVNLLKTLLLKGLWERLSKKILSNWIPIAGSLIAVVFIVLFCIVLIGTGKGGKEELGEMAVKLMYNFQTLDELDDNMDALKEITTEDVYNNLTIDRTDRTLSVYLKFNNKPVTVVIDESSDSHVIYSLNTESISANRKFVFFYEVGKKGKIEKIRESELIDFTTNP